MDSTTHMHGLAVYVKEGLPFAQDLSLENSPDSYLCLWLALRHSVSRRICDSDDKFEDRSVQYQKNLVARDYKPIKVKKQFSDVRNISREEARRPKNNNNFSVSCNLIT